MNYTNIFIINQICKLHKRHLSRIIRRETISVSLPHKKETDYLFSKTDIFQRDHLR